MTYRTATMDEPRCASCGRPASWHRVHAGRVLCHEPVVESPTFTLAHMRPLLESIATYTDLNPPAPFTEPPLFDPAPYATGPIQPTLWDGRPI